ncbi:MULTISPECIES: YolD-like family protein [Bacillus]|uniref:YolD-like family protein n=2 Tax=Bacillus TaxID=1386 RepID=A0A0M5JI39_9BACI|nr:MULTISPECIES: YolD-like family protein [Bacillus]ALC80319.1 hypothetical protein AM592_00920 [Bacillus gobiensis]MBP1083842.1 hypothetical protein [Bacillus capparidis]MED1098325.1 YolD-like family protein [Bacillus capparidis]
MILNALRKNSFITVNYYENGSLKTSKGRISHLNVYEQHLTLIDEHKKTYSIRLSAIKEIQ